MMTEPIEQPVYAIVHDATISDDKKWRIEIDGSGRVVISVSPRIKFNIAVATEAAILLHEVVKKFEQAIEESVTMLYGTTSKTIH